MKKLLPLVLAAALAAAGLALLRRKLRRVANVNSKCEKNIKKYI